ncbi:hypothetical protein J7J63_05845 [Candidatus Bipolaricaulota bacterium]|nr:hypothetical protein [Candidatus Bipolaricaulota bacterium]
MTNDYLSLIQRNTIVPYASNGFQRSHYCNAIILMDASVKQIAISVFANTAFEATHYANLLKGYIEQNPMRGDDVSIGLVQPIWDPAQHAFKCDMMMLTGQLTVTQSRKPIWYGAFSLCLGCDFERMIKPADKEAFCWEFKPAFSTAFKNRTVATKGTTNCGTCTDKG